MSLKLKSTNSSSILNKFTTFLWYSRKKKTFAGSHHSAFELDSIWLRMCWRNHPRFSHLISYGKSKPAGWRLADRGLASTCNENRTTRVCAGAQASNWMFDIAWPPDRAHLCRWRARRVSQEQTRPKLKVLLNKGGDVGAVFLAATWGNALIGFLSENSDLGLQLQTARPFGAQQFALSFHWRGKVLNSHTQTWGKLPLAFVPRRPPKLENIRFH